MKKKYRNDIQLSNTRSVGNDFVALWEKVVQIIDEVASKYDKQWQVRKRVINSMLIILVIFRLICSTNSQSYGTTIDELWDSCDKLDIPLPQNGSIAPSSSKQREILLKNPNLEIIPIQMRLIKYQIDDNIYCLGTTLIDKKRYNNV